MADVRFNTALIVGAGSDFPPRSRRALSRTGSRSRSRAPGDLDSLVKETGAKAFACDASQRADVEKLFAELDGSLSEARHRDLNASYRTVDRSSISIGRGQRSPSPPMVRFWSADGGAANAAEQTRRDPAHRRIGGREGYAQSAPFAMSKFALRGMAQSMARELSPQGIHVAHVVIDGGIRARRPHSPDAPDSLPIPTRSPRAICISFASRAAWAWEIELRPWVEKF